MAINKLIMDTPFRNIDPYMIRNNVWLMQDMIFNEGMSLKKRFGGSEFADLLAGDEVQGLFWWSENNILIVVANGRVFKVTNSAGAFTEITNGVSLDSSTRATFAKVADSANSNTSTLFIAVQNQIVYTTNGDCEQFPTGVTGTAPTNVSHVASLDTYLLVNDLDNPNVWYASEAGTPFVWTNKQQITAQAKPDNILGLYQSGNNIYLQGEDGIEPFYNSGTAQPWLRINGGLIEPGTVNAYAVGVVNKQQFFLNTNRDLVTLNGINPVVLSQPYSSRIQELDSIVDAEIDIIESMDGHKLLLMTFKDAEKTFVYDIGLKITAGKDVFYEFGKWNTETGSYDKFPYRCYAFCPDWNLHIMGSSTEGKIFSISFDTYQDDGDSILSECVTGIYGNPMISTSVDDLFFDVRRGDGKSDAKTTAPKLYFQTRDDNQVSWTKQHEVDLGKEGQTARERRKRPMSSYYTRQYRIRHQDNSPFILNGLWESTVG